MNLGSSQNACLEKNATLVVEPFHKKEYQPMLFNLFQQYGNIISFQNIPHKKSVTISYKAHYEANNAKLALNGRTIDGQKICVSFLTEKKDTLDDDSPTQFILFLKKVPSYISKEQLTELIDSKFGIVLDLNLKKESGKEDEDEHLGYGHVEFEDEEDLIEMLQQQQIKGHIYFKKQNFSIQVEKIKDKNDYTNLNMIHVAGFFEKQILPSEAQQKQREIHDIFEELKKNFSEINRVSFQIEYNSQKKNFWAKIYFYFSTDDEEDEIYQEVRSTILNYFSYSNSLKGPEISFTPIKNNQQQIFVLGLLNNVDSEDLASWLSIYLDISVEEKKISIRQIVPKTPYPSSSSKRGHYSALINFNSLKDSQKFQEFCSSKDNREALNKIVEKKFKVDIYSKKSESNKNKEKSQQELNFFAQTQQPFTFPFEKLSFDNVKVKIVPQKQDISNGGNLQTTISEQVFRYYSLYFTKSIKEFNSFSLEKQLSILSQFIRYQIDNPNEYQAHLKTFNRSDEQTQKLINNIQKKRQQIIDMMINPQIHTVGEIVQLIQNPVQFVKILINTASIFGVH